MIPHSFPHRLALDRFSALAIVLLLGWGVSHPRHSPAQETIDFDWSVPPRYSPQNNEGVISLFDQENIIAPESWPVLFDACASTAALRFYRWSIDGQMVGEVDSCDSFSFDFPEEGTFQVTLSGQSDDGQSHEVTHEVTVQDWLIIGLGDSYASGEGVPDQEISESARSDFSNALAGLDVSEDALDQAQSSRDQVQAQLNETLQDVEKIRTRANTLQERIDRQNDVCPFPINDCAQAIAAVTSASASLLSALEVIGLGNLISNLTAIEGAVVDHVRAALDAVGVAQAAVDQALQIRNLARVDLDNARVGSQPLWQNRRCHRSALAGQSLAAIAVEAADPRTSVTFVSVACSGGTILRGLIGEDRGIEDIEGAEPLAPQLEQIATLIGRREIDAVIVSIGGNDIGFGQILQSCITENPCHNPPTTPDLIVPVLADILCNPLLVGIGAPDCSDYLGGTEGESALETFDRGIAELPGLFDMLNEGFSTYLPRLKPERIFFTEYPNLTRDENDQLCAFDESSPLTSLPGFTESELSWAETELTQRLNQTIGGNTQRHGWNFIGGADSIFSRSTAHGYCAADPWIVQLTESATQQGDAFGTAHPNRAGHRNYADAIVLNLLDANLYTGSQPRQPRSNCTGDCNADRLVTVDEILTGVNAALGELPLHRCPALDSSGDGAATVDEIQRAVTSALSGCPEVFPNIDVVL